jgi:cytochrome o ubiquinol oxidase subunit 2
VVPADTPVSLKLTSATVMNSFFVPQLAGQIYTMAGMTTQLNLLADHPGQYPGLSAQFSGDGFSGMRFTVESVSPDQFATWLSDTRSRGPVLDEAGYAALAKPSQYVAPFTYRAIDPALFDRIAAMRPATALPASSGRGGADAAAPANSRKGS